MRRCDLVEAAGHLACIEAAAEHLRREQPDARTDRAGDKHLEDPFAVMIDRYIEILSFERDPPCGALQLTRTVYPLAGPQAASLQVSFCKTFRDLLLGSGQAGSLRPGGLHGIQNLALTAAVAIIA